MASCFEVVITKSPGFDVFSFCSIFHGERDDGIGVVVVHDKNVLMALSGYMWEASCEV